MLTDDHLRISHFGATFNEKDVRGVCGIGKSTKEITEIGRFGIGFKSVFAFTDRPEIHSGSADFIIENYVKPRAAPAVRRDNNETVILIPFRQGDKTSKQEISDALSKLGTTSLLFLREINEIYWDGDGIQSGFYLRQSKTIDQDIQQVEMIEQNGQGQFDDQWLVFSRAVDKDDGRFGDYVEIAWSTSRNEIGTRRLGTVNSSPLVAFFPTVVETHLGFLIQGPYQTTPNRDNVARQDESNRTVFGRPDCS
ncbi:MAG: hypothetical protein OXC62_10285 [Aestuariivita sp.]|nr:hypothetical protein [Aestuariivita sp.]